ncbi:helix-turn-helix domain-containing protein [Catenulispora rubra]|uniref:helix-turn-helix domain-containing protein n=1 Tax=Catenulispora rubra TaxID=280293 RepID=UPI0018920982|nr:helix-turn-helix domain-containing protein [Catenulispora rubra]
MRRVLTLSEVGDLPVVLDVEEAGALLGIGRTNAYRMVRRGQFPTRVIRIGGQWRVPTADLLHLLGLAPPTPAPDPDTDPPRSGLSLVNPDLDVKDLT